MLLNIFCILAGIGASLAVGGIILGLIDYHIEQARNRALNRQNDYLKRCLERAKSQGTLSRK